MLGPPGSGKGTQAKMISSTQGSPAISTGDMLRSAVKEGSDLGLAAQAHIEAGSLVPDEVMIGLIRTRIGADDCNNGFILDGFPRTIPQAQALIGQVELDLILELTCDFEGIVTRLAGRRIHPGSGRVYHLQHQPPQREGVDDLTGETLVQRPDDREEVIRERLRVYHTQTAPLSAFMAAGGPGIPTYTVVQGDKPIAAVTAAVAAAIA